MSTAQIAPASRLLGPADPIIANGTSNVTTEAFFLVDSNTAPGWDLLIEPWDLAVKIESGAVTDSAHVIETSWTNKVRLDKNIFTGASATFSILRGSEWALRFPPGTDMEFYSVQAREKRGNQYQGVELHKFNLQTRRRTPIFSGPFGDGMDANGVFEKLGRNLQANWLESLIVVNYIQANVNVSVEGVDVTIAGFVNQ